MFTFVLMLLAAAGMIFGIVKMKQDFDWGRGLAAGCAIVALLLAGAHLKSSMGKGRMSKKEIAKIMQREADYRRVGAEKLARMIAAKVPGGKAVVIRPVDYGVEIAAFNDSLAGLKAGFGNNVQITDILAPEIPEEYKLRMEEMKKQYAQDSGGVEPSPDLMMEFGSMMDALPAVGFTGVTRRIPAGTDIVVFLIDFPFDMQDMAVWAMKPMPMVAAVVNMTQPAMKAAIKGAFIDAIVLQKPDFDFEAVAVPKDLDEAFARRFILVTPENVDEYGAMFPEF